jgi:hypothetical protein
MILTELERNEVLYACHIAKAWLENKYKDKGPHFDLPYSKRKIEAEKMLDYALEIVDRAKKRHDR